MPSDFDPAMTAVEGVVVRAGIGPGVREAALDFGARNRPVVLQSEQIVRSLVADCLGDFGLTPRGVEGDQDAGQFQARQQAWKLSAGSALMTSLRVSCESTPFANGKKRRGKSGFLLPQHSI